MKRIAAIAAILLGSAFVLTACTNDKNVDEKAYNEVDSQASGRSPYIPKNDVEYNNYNEAQKLYDSPDSIIWCTTTWGNASAPLVTVPIAGKLTSSSVSYFPNERRYGNATDLMVEARSVDGMFHGSPPPYRYGFTPGGQYVDFANMPTFCTTALTEFQRQSTTVSVAVDGSADSIQKEAEKALKAGDPAKAQQLLEGVGK